MISYHFFEISSGESIIANLATFFVWQLQSHENNNDLFFLARLLPAIGRYFG